MLPRQGTQAFDAGPRAERVVVRALHLVNPLDSVERHGGGQGKFFSPAAGGKTLDAAALRRQEPALHDSDAWHWAPPRQSGNGSINMLLRNSARSKNGH